MEKSFPFDSEIVDGKPDRAYTSEIFRKYFFSFVNNGVFAEKGNALQVLSKVPNAMQVVVKSGQAFGQGAFYDNDNDLVLQVPDADPVLNRYDAVVVRFDYTERFASCIVKKGVPATRPQHYIPQRNVDAFELVLAEIYVPYASIIIKQENINDLRTNNNLCGWVTGYLQSIDSETFFDTYKRQYEEFMKDAEDGFGNQILTINDWFSQVKNDIALLQAFDFDNLAVLPNCRYSFKEEESLGDFQDKVIEEILNINTQHLVAKRITTFPSGNIIKIQTIKYNSDGVSEVDNTLQTFDLGAGDVVEITGKVENNYKPK